ncbi:MAG: metal ABC transporter solute-binding protein, Zn/Mn family [Candidatus Aenigmatarchaeota archaeon]
MKIGEEIKQKEDDEYKRQSTTLLIAFILLLGVGLAGSGCIENQEDHQIDAHVWMSPKNVEMMIDNFVPMFNEARQDADEEVMVAVSIPPQVEWVEEIGGEKVEVVVMIPPGEDPHTYEPTPSQMQKLGEADIYFKVGSGLEFEERWMDEMKDQNPDMKVVDGSEGIDLLRFDDDHEQENHALLSEKIDGEEESYKSKLQNLHHNLTESFEPHQGRKFLIYHPSLGYFADEYGLKQIAVEAEGKEPGPKDIEKIIEEAKEEGILVVFISPQFDEDQAESIAEEIDGEVITVDSLAEDYLDNIEKIAEALIYGFEKA